MHISFKGSSGGSLVATPDCEIAVLGSNPAISPAYSGLPVLRWAAIWMALCCKLSSEGRQRRILTIGTSFYQINYVNIFSKAKLKERIAIYVNTSLVGRLVIIYKRPGSIYGQKQNLSIDISWHCPFQASSFKAYLYSWASLSFTIFWWYCPF